MKHLVLLLFFLLFLLPWLANSQERASLHYSGQSSDNLRVSYLAQEAQYRQETRYRTETQYRQETRYRDETRYETCTRQVPYNENICQQVPRNETVCHPGYPRQECYMEGGGVVCTMENGRRVCRNEPPHQVCRQVPGGQICENVVRYENVCRYETCYRTESYSCPRVVRVAYTENVPYTVNVPYIENVPYTVNVTKYKDVEFRFENAMGDIQADIFASADQMGRVLLSAIERTNRALVVAYREDFSNENSESFLISFLPKERVLNPFKAPPRQIQLAQSEMRFVMNKRFAPRQLRVDLSFRGRYGEAFSRTLSEEEINFRDISQGETLATIDLRSLGFYPSESSYEVSVTLSLDVRGEVLNKDAPLSQTSSQWISVTGM